MKEIFLLGTIGCLLLVGLMIALGSGEETAGRTSRMGGYVGNLAVLTLRLAGYGVGLFVVHRAIGAPSLPLW
ncbi:MAG: hypothetical protein U0794_16665 [Isosphaeraceae bacterium]